MSRLAIVIVSFNAKADLARTLESLSDAPPRTPHDIFVVDNASTDGAPDLVRERFPRVRLLEQGANLGFARATNLGIRSATGDLVFLLNPDTFVTPGAVDRLVARLDASPGIGVIGPRLVDASGRAELSHGGAVSPIYELKRKILLALDARGNAAARKWIERQTSHEQTVRWVTGAALLVRRADAVAAGLLDERYFLYMEDVDFCDAVRRLGKTVVFSPVAQIVHVRGRSGLATGSRTQDAWQQSHLAYYEKHLPLWAPWLRVYLKLKGL